MRVWAYHHRQVIAWVYAILALTVVLVLQVLETSGVIK